MEIALSQESSAEQQLQQIQQQKEEAIQRQRQLELQRQAITNPQKRAGFTPRQQRVQQQQFINQSQEEIKSLQNYQSQLGLQEQQVKQYQEQLKAQQQALADYNYGVMLAKQGYPGYFLKGEQLKGFSDYLGIGSSMKGGGAFGQVQTRAVQAAESAKAQQELYKFKIENPSEKFVYKQGEIAGIESGALGKTFGSLEEYNKAVAQNNLDYKDYLANLEIASGGQKAMSVDTSKLMTPNPVSLKQVGGAIGKDIIKSILRQSQEQKGLSLGYAPFISQQTKQLAQTYFQGKQQGSLEGAKQYNKINQETINNIQNSNTYKNYYKYLQSQYPDVKIDNNAALTNFLNTESGIKTSEKAFNQAFADYGKVNLATLKTAGYGALGGVVGYLPTSKGESIKKLVTGGIVVASAPRIMAIKGVGLLTDTLIGGYSLGQIVKPSATPIEKISGAAGLALIGGTRLTESLFKARFKEVKIPEPYPKVRLIRPVSKTENIPILNRIINQLGKEIEIGRAEGAGLAMETKGGNAVLVTTRARELLGMKPIYAGSPYGNFIQIGNRVIEIKRGEALKGYNKALKILQRRGLTEYEARQYMRYNAFGQRAISTSLKSQLARTGDETGIEIRETKIESPVDLLIQRVKPKGSRVKIEFKSAGGKPRITKTKAEGKEILPSEGEEGGIGEINKYLFRAEETKINYGRLGKKTSKSLQKIEVQRRMKITNELTGETLEKFAQRDVTKDINKILINKPRQTKVKQVKEGISFKVGKPKVTKGEQVVYVKTKPTRVVNTIDYLNGKAIREVIDKEGKVISRIEKDLPFSVKSDLVGGGGKPSQDNINSIFTRLEQKVTPKTKIAKESSIRAATDSLFKNRAEAQKVKAVAKAEQKEIQRLRLQQKQKPTQKNLGALGSALSSIGQVKSSQQIKQELRLVQRENLGLRQMNNLMLKTNLGLAQQPMMKQELALKQTLALRMNLRLRTAQPRATIRTPRPQVRPKPRVPVIPPILFSRRKEVVVKKKKIKEVRGRRGYLLTPTISQEISGERRKKPISLTRLTGFEKLTI